VFKFSELYEVKAKKNAIFGNYLHIKTKSGFTYKLSIRNVQNVVRLLPRT
jgi:hypothetical protein